MSQCKRETAARETRIRGYGGLRWDEGVITILVVVRSGRGTLVIFMSFLPGDCKAGLGVEP